MADLIQVVVMSNAEREAIGASCAAAEAKAVGDEVAASLKAGDKELRELLRSDEVSQDSLSRAKELLIQRLEQLDQLPNGPARTKHRQNVAEALEAINGGLALY